MTEPLYDNQRLTPPPCEQCWGACCRATSGHRFAVMLLPTDAPVPGETVVHEGGMGWRVLPYIEETGGCPNLQPEGRCGIHEIRPTLCRVFNCRSALHDDGSPGEFLRENPKVYELLEQVDGGTPSRGSNPAAERFRRAEGLADNTDESDAG